MSSMPVGAGGVRGSTIAPPPSPQIIVDELIISEPGERLCPPNYSVRPKPLFSYRSETQIGQYRNRYRNHIKKILIVWSIVSYHKRAPKTKFAVKYYSLRSGFIFKCIKSYITPRNKKKHKKNWKKKFRLRFRFLIPKPGFGRTLPHFLQVNFC